MSTSAIAPQTPGKLGPGKLGQLPAGLLLDGGMGTSLIARGLDLSKESTADWNWSRPEQVVEVHRAFVEAGAQAIQTNSFVANRFFHPGQSVEECNRMAAQLARRAAGTRAYVIGSIGPSGQTPPPQGDANLVELEASFAEQARALAEGGVDFLHLETFGNPKEMRAALRGCRIGAADLAVVASFSAKRKARQSRSGHLPDMSASHSEVETSDFVSLTEFSIDSILSVVEEEQADGIGVNCMLTPQEMLPLIKELHLRVSLPLFAKPTIAPLGVAPLFPDEFAEGVAALFSAGARGVGGCCGTGAKDIACAARRIRRGYR